MEFHEVESYRSELRVHQINPGKTKGKVLKDAGIHGSSKGRCESKTEKDNNKI